MMEQYIWLVGGSIMAYPMAKEIKRRGYKLIISDGNPDAICRSMADEFHCINCYDPGLHRGIIRTFPPEKYIVAALTIGTDAGPTVAAIRAELLIEPEANVDVARRIKNKYLMRGHLGDLNKIEWAWVSKDADKNELAKTGKRLGYPFFIKPTEQSGSRGLLHIQSEADLPEKLEGEYIAEQAVKPYQLLPEAEQYGMDTSEVAIDCLIHNGKFRLINAALRLFWKDRPGIEAGHINPFDGRWSEYADIEPLAKEAAKRLGVTNGAFKLDLKRDVNKGWVILEAATRLSGGFDHMLSCRAATDRDITGAYLNHCLGLDPWYMLETADHYMPGYVCVYAPKVEPGKIDGWNYDDDYTQYGLTPDTEPGLFYSLDLFPMAMQEIKPLTCNQDRPIFICGLTSDEPLLALTSAMREAKYIKPIRAEND